MLEIFVGRDMKQHHDEQHLPEGELANSSALAIREDQKVKAICPQSLAFLSESLGLGTGGTWIMLDQLGSLPQPPNGARMGHVLVATAQVLVGCGPDPRDWIPITITGAPRIEDTRFPAYGRAR